MCLHPCAWSYIPDDCPNNFEFILWLWLYFLTFFFLSSWSRSTFWPFVHGTAKTGLTFVSCAVPFARDLLRDGTLRGGKCLDCFMASTADYLLCVYSFCKSMPQDVTLCCRKGLFYFFALALCLMHARWLLTVDHWGLVFCAARTSYVVFLLWRLPDSAWSHIVYRGLLKVGTLCGGNFLCCILAFTAAYWGVSFWFIRRVLYFTWYIGRVLYKRILYITCDVRRFLYLTWFLRRAQLLTKMSSKMLGLWKKPQWK